MNKLNWIRLGFYASLSLLLLSAVVMIWPYVTGYYLQVTGLAAGIIGSTFFGMALAAQQSQENEGEAM